MQENLTRMQLLLSTDSRLIAWNNHEVKTSASDDHAVK